jgi:catechol 2,3-dioxygenase-like lactoylglutathione lyase family enzyme
MSERRASMKWSFHHVGLAVPDLDQAVDFFQNALGCDVVMRSDPYENVGYVWPGEDSPEPATVRLAILTHGGTQNIELLEYRNKPSGPEPTAPRPSDRGTGHLCFDVEDVQAAVDHLMSWEGVQVLGAVDTETEGPLAGLDWVYLSTPWGLAIELVRWVPGLPYEQTTSARLVAAPWRATSDV